MRWTTTLIPTLKETPAEAEVISHKLMIRAGFIRKVAAGIYTYLPLALKVLRKIEVIIREEMTQAGSQELLLPVVMPAEMWVKTGRWDYYGKELLRFKDRSEREFCIGPTHEEAITDLVAREIKSYRDLPRNFFQIQTKFRDEIRPRFGLMRGREFIMKDAYSFDVSEEAARISYKAMYEAYLKIFKRCGLEFRAVEAATGAIGGTLSHEFQVIADSGEDALFFCDQCDYAANVERARTISQEKLTALNKKLENIKPPSKYQEISTPGAGSVSDVAQFLKVSEGDLVKTILYKIQISPKKLIFVAALVRGSDEIIEAKLVKALYEGKIIETADVQMTLVDEKGVKDLTKASVGFAGPIGLSKDVIIAADSSLCQERPFITGANKNDTHLKNVHWEDCGIRAFVNICRAREGDSCPECAKGHLKEKRGIEVGQVFYLGTKYSEKMEAAYLDEKGEKKLMVMGCYGIGVGRTAAAVIEQSYDEKGIIWPLPVAPCHCHLISLAGGNEEVGKAAEAIYSKLSGSGIEVLYDDRDSRAGVKFADADLIGIPYQIVVGSKSLKEGVFEFKERKTGKTEKFSADQMISKIKEGLA